MKTKTRHNKFLYRCNGCGLEIDGADGVHYLCPECSKSNTNDAPPAGVLKLEYDYHTLRHKYPHFIKLKETDFIDLLPVQNISSLPKLKVGNTPLYHYDQLQGEPLPFHFFLKDDSQNPTFSYKDRASALVSAFAYENELDTIVAASTGNAGSSLAGICAAQQQKAVIMVPESAPIAKISQVLMYGAALVPVKGTYDDAFDLSIKASETFGWYNRNTGYNPLTIEGKKTAAFELFEQMGGQRIDRIFVSVGDGVIISGIYKGFEDLIKLGFIDEMPTIVAVQSEKSDNLVRNLDQPAFTAVPSTTIADSISVDIPRNFYMARQFIHQYSGEGIAVRDEEILSASSMLARNTGIFAEPAATAAFAGMLKYREKGLLETNSNNIVMLTGSGLKDLQAISRSIKIPDAIEPDIEILRGIFTHHKARK
jgi:threonine synthase